MSERPRARSDVRCRMLDDGFVLIDPRNDMAHTLNVVASIIWDSCDGEHTLEQIAEELRTLQGSEGRDILGDVNEAVDSFRKAGLLDNPVRAS